MVESKKLFLEQSFVRLRMLVERVPNICLLFVSLCFTDNGPVYLGGGCNASQAIQASYRDGFDAANDDTTSVIHNGVHFVSMFGSGPAGARVLSS